MSKSADFYVGVGKDAEWIGSVPEDGSIDGYSSIFKSETEAEYRKSVKETLWDSSFSLHPSAETRLGVPSALDYSYTFKDGQVWISLLGRKFVPVADYLSFTTEQNESYLREPCG